MPKEIDSDDAKTQLPELLRKVAVGETFTITKHGKPIADLIPSRTAARKKKTAAINNILKTKKHTVPDTLLSELKEIGHN